MGQASSYSSSTLHTGKQRSGSKCRPFSRGLWRVARAVPLLPLPWMSSSWPRDLLGLPLRCRLQSGRSACSSSCCVRGARSKQQPVTATAPGCRLVRAAAAARRCSHSLSHPRAEAVAAALLARTRNWLFYDNTPSRLLLLLLTSDSLLYCGYCCVVFSGEISTHAR